MTFDLIPLRCRFTAVDPVHFPAGKAGNVLRGALGIALRDGDTAAWARFFAPSAAGAGPSGLADPPRPFVLRARHLDGRTVPPGLPFWVDVNVFETREDVLPSFAAAFREMARAGLGPGRGRCVLESLEPRGPAPLRLSLEPADGPVPRARVEFLSPTELKPASRPEFAVLFARARDRVATLRALYGAGPLEIDFAALGQRAALVRTTRCEIAHVDLERHSSRTGQTHPIGGFTGVADYEGDLGEFLPYLLAAQWTGVGRHTVWGNGEIRVTLPG
jgi:hypothetical protein